MPNIVLASVEPFTQFVSDMVKIVNTLTLPELRVLYWADEYTRLPKGFYFYPLAYDPDYGLYCRCSEASRAQEELDEMQESKDVDAYTLGCAEARFTMRAEATADAIRDAISKRYAMLRAGELVSLYGFTRAKRIMRGLERDPRDAEAEAEWYEDAINRAERRMEFANDSRMAGVDIDWDTFSSL
jgi:hypothetical protein